MLEAIRARYSSENGLPWQTGKNMESPRVSAAKRCGNKPVCVAGGLANALASGNRYEASGAESSQVFFASATYGVLCRKARTVSIGVALNARDVTNEAERSSVHVTTVPPWPARPIALRGFSESDTTRLPGCCIRNWSANVGTLSSRPLKFDFVCSP